MNFINQLKALLYKEFIIEWRSKNAIQGIILYIFSTILTCYLSFKKVAPPTCNALFWIIILFTAIYTISKSFTQESQAVQFYYYTIAHPQSIILSKIIYNTALMFMVISSALLVYNLVFENYIVDTVYYFMAIALGSLGFSSVLTMTSALSSHANSQNTLMSILSFPIITPMLILLIKLSRNAMEGIERAISFKEIKALAALDILVISISLLLFPYLWRD